MTNLLRSLVLLSFVFLTPIAFSAPDSSCCNWDWNKHSRAGACVDLKKTCEELMSTQKEASLSAYMCKTNASICGKGGKVKIGGRNSQGQHIMTSGYEQDELVEAISWLDKAERDFPQAKHVVFTQLQIFGLAGDGDSSASVTDRFLKRAKEKPEVEAWLGSFEQFFELGAFDSAIALGKVIAIHYPDSHKIHGNLGGAYAMAGKDSEAAEHLLKAVNLAPRDPINRWNLARLYDFTEKLPLADEHYSRSIQDEMDATRKSEMRCSYATFIERKLKDPKRAAKIRPDRCGRS